MQSFTLDCPARDLIHILKEEQFMHETFREREVRKLSRHNSDNEEYLTFAIPGQKSTNPQANMYVYCIYILYISHSNQVALLLYEFQQMAAPQELS